MSVHSKSILRFLVSIFVLIFCCSSYVKSANILGLLGVASPSHQIWNGVLLNALALRGHNVTVISVDLPKNPSETPENVHYIHLEEAYNFIYNSDTDENFQIKDLIGIGILKEVQLFYTFGFKESEGSLKSKGLQTLLNYPDDFKFDLVIHDYTLGSVLLGFLPKFKYPPLIGVTAFHNPPCTVDNVGGHYYTSYIPFHSMTYDVDMNFFERIHNTAAFLVDALYRRYIFQPKADKLMRQHFPYDLPYLDDLERRTLIALVNAHPAINYPEPMPPNVIEVGGLQIVDPKPLPNDLESFIQGSKKGAILFSLGTNMKADDMGPEKIKIVLSAMAQLPEYNFLWKFDLDDVKFKVPKNVLIKSFFPQRDILAHPKIKAFATHAGGLSTQEATWRGVPMIGLALFVDQLRNLHKAILAGAAVKVDYLTMTTDILRDTIREVAENKTYAENMKLRSARFRDQPMKPLDTAIWWVEYILRNPNPDHLKSPTFQLGFFRSHCLDILLAVLVVLFLFIFIVCKIITVLCSLFKNSTKKQQVNSDKKYK